MEQDYWWLLALGTVFSVGVTVLFLYALFLGLRQRRWWPLFIVLTVWLAGMVAYSAWDGERRRENARRRADELLSQMQRPAVPRPPKVEHAGSPPAPRTASL
ncbi:MAG: hypothetical protein AAGA68_16160 [Pseudomonadota bacterium]